MWSEYIAHKECIQDSVKTQSLATHLYNTAVYASRLGEPVGLSSMCKLIGLLHDLGKAAPMWQMYIQDERDSGGDHATVGGYYVDHILFPSISAHLAKQEFLQYKQYNEFLIYPILAHHGMYDVLKEHDFHIENHTEQRLAKVSDKIEPETAWEQIFSEFTEWVQDTLGVTIVQLYQDGYLEFMKWMQKLQQLAKSMPQQKNNALQFYRGASIRLLLSILKEADIYDSSNWCVPTTQHVYTNEERTHIFESMAHQVEHMYEQFRQALSPSSLNVVRTVIADEVCQSVEKTPQGCFTLGLPVGAGKTNAVLRYALQHSLRWQNARIFYTTAFLSVLEQNAQDIQSIIGKEHVLEHHSNVIPDSTAEIEENEYDSTAYLKESWESPVILTTLVQLSNTLFKSQSSCLRRFSKLIQSIVVIDEVQSLPRKTIYLNNLMTNFLTHMMHATVIHCTATLPELQNDKRLTYPCLYGQVPDMATTQLASSAYFCHPVFQRVQFYSLMGPQFVGVLGTEQVVQHVQEELQSAQSILLIANTKQGVKNLYDVLHETLGNDVEVYYLTTNLCAAHRLARIQQIKRRLQMMGTRQEAAKPLICISTKLIEAGVNISFDVVFRSLTSIDSVLQAAGRCNREGLLPQGGRVFLFQYKGENIQRIPEFALEREAATEALRHCFRNRDITAPLPLETCLSLYFSRLYQKSTMLSYPVSSEGQPDSLRSMLSENALQVKQYEHNHHHPGFVLRQRFKTAAALFHVIDEEQAITAIVPYQNEDLMERLYEALEQQDWPSIKETMQQLQRYTVTIHKGQDYRRYMDMNPLLQKWNMCVLSPEAYDEQIGLVKGEMNELIF